jgi:hypothetical protein
VVSKAHTRHRTRMDEVEEYPLSPGEYLAIEHAMALAEYAQPRKRPLVEESGVDAAHAQPAQAARPTYKARSRPSSFVSKPHAVDPIVLAQASPQVAPEHLCAVVRADAASRRARSLVRPSSCRPPDK